MERNFDMGNRLHVAKVYNVRYGNTTGFNYKVEEFHDLLSSLGVDYTGDSYDDDFEVSRDDWNKGISKLENMERLDHDEVQGIQNSLKELGYGRNEVIQLFKDYEAEAEPSSDFLEFSFF